MGFQTVPNRHLILTQNKKVNVFNFFIKKYYGQFILSHLPTLLLVCNLMYSEANLTFNLPLQY